MLSLPLPHAELPHPLHVEASSQILDLSSTLADLPLHWWTVDGNQRGSEVAHLFEQYPDVPGIVVQQPGHPLGLISRRRFLEYLLRPHGGEWFLAQPLRVLYSYARCPTLRLSEQTPILQGAQQALQRSPDQRPDPILVQRRDGLVYLLDIHELYRADWQLRGIETQARFERFHLQMVQQDKMAALGRLVDGVAHEILDPVSFIWGNLVHVASYVEQLLELVAVYEAEDTGPSAAIATLQQDIELPYLKTDLPQALHSIRTGADRLKKLASSLQTFCHIDEIHPHPADLHTCLDSLVLLLESHLAGNMRFTRQYQPLPPVPCYLGQLNQVLITLLSHAVENLLTPSLQAVWTTPPSTHPRVSPLEPEITITTQICSEPQADRSNRWVVITIANNGPPLSSEQYAQIQNSFSVEQRMTKETSLAMSYQIVTARHGGRLEVRSPYPPTADGNPGDRGTAFLLWLPLL